MPESAQTVPACTIAAYAHVQQVVYFATHLAYHSILIICVRRLHHWYSPLLVFCAMFPHSSQHIQNLQQTIRFIRQTRLY